MAWTYVFLAAIVEVFWVLGLRFSDSLIDWLGTIFFIVLSFILIIKACEKIASGTVYAVFTGLGAASIVILDFLFFGADFSFKKLFFIVLIIVGVIGLKLTTEAREETAKKEAN